MLLLSCVVREPLDAAENLRQTCCFVMRPAHMSSRKRQAQVPAWRTRRQGTSVTAEQGRATPCQVFSNRISRYSPEGIRGYNGSGMLSRRNQPARQHARPVAADKNQTRPTMRSNDNQLNCEARQQQAGGGARHGENDKNEPTRKRSRAEPACCAAENAEKDAQTDPFCPTMSILNHEVAFCAALRLRLLTLHGDVKRE